MPGSQIDRLAVDHSPLGSATSSLDAAALTIDDPDAPGLEDAPLDPSTDATAPDWAPTVVDIAQLMPAATRGKFLDAGQSAGAQQLIFTPGGDPSDATVRGYIVAACNEVIGRVGVGSARTDMHSDLAKLTASWYVVMLIARNGNSGRLADEDGALQTATREYMGNLTELAAQARRVLPRLS